MGKVVIIFHFHFFIFFFVSIEYLYYISFLSWTFQKDWKWYGLDILNNVTFWLNTEESLHFFVLFPVIVEIRVGLKKHFLIKHLFISFKPHYLHERYKYHKNWNVESHRE